ncbi:hypothetical protein J5288_06705 [Agrobacterium sp. S2/73]|uniref:hypothetical protein n=1 Tax=unclassified Agrobacterium TaxID=2632611 RepID=UPI001ADB9D11|nr:MULTISPECIES: hypothetical protein [unclassified Agrobacterium]MBO9108392.1 hypothetical protein [Agrobacterium sp. S2/73]QXZ71030.1 hypothetical protein J5276_07810 [Agrobacterium sp. S7/73]
MIQIGKAYIVTVLDAENLTNGEKWREDILECRAINGSLVTFRQVEVEVDDDPEELLHEDASKKAPPSEVSYNVNSVGFHSVREYTGPRKAPPPVFIGVYGGKK